MTREERKIQREIDFTDWWFREHKGAPTYADAIEWADKTMIEKTIDILMDLSNDGCLIDIHNHEEFEKQFRKRMEE
jgi:hypothetical protein